MILPHFRNQEEADHGLKWDERAKEFWNINIAATPYIALP